jgi:2-hydroxy-4-(methylsulfanyl)butanoate S-methyltransferase
MTETIQPVTIRSLAEGVYAPMAMKAAMQLDLFTPLKDGPMSGAELAGVLGLNADRFTLLLYALVSAGLLTVEDGCFANTPEANRFLVRGVPGYLGNQHHLYDDLWGGMLHTGNSLQSGVPGAKHDFSIMTEAALGNFYRGTHPGALSAGRTLVALVDLSDARHLVDVGGGSGGVSIGLCETYPDLRATIAEFDAVVPVTKSIIADENMTGRIDVIAADAVANNLPGEYDAAILRNLIQVLSADDAAAALSHIASAIKPGGVVYIWGWMIDDSRITPADSVLHNIAFLNLYDNGQAYSEGEHRGWLADAGFKDMERQILPGGFSLMSARKE